MQRGTTATDRGTGQAAGAWRGGSWARPRLRRSRRPAKPSSGARPRRTGLEYARVFAREGVDPFDEIEWETRSAVISNEKGAPVFEQRDVEDPEVLVADGHQHRRLEVLPRHPGHARAASAASSS